VSNIADLTNLDALLKNVYEDGIVSWVERDLTLAQRIERNTDQRNFQGRKAIIAVKDGDTQAVGSRAEYGVLPSPQKSTILNMEVGMAYHYAVIEITRQLIATSRTSPGAFAQAIDTEVNSARKSLQENLARQMVFGDGTGWLARVSSGGGTTSLVMRAQPTHVGMPGVRNLRKGMVIDAYDGTSGAANKTGDSLTITAINDSTNTVTISAAGTIANGDYIFLEDSFRVEGQGLAGIVDDGTRVGTFQNLSRTTYPNLACNTLGNGGTLRAWSRKLMDTAAAKAKQRNGYGWPSAIYSRLEVQQVAADVLAQDRRYDAKTMKLDNGYEALAWTTPGGTLPWIDDYYCRDNEVQFVHEGDLVRYVLEEIQFDRFTGTMWVENGDRKHAYEARLFTFQNMAGRRCNLHTRLEDISYTL
jgi:hypothetical protein